MKTVTLSLMLMVSCQLFSQSTDTSFFPQFTPYSEDPIIDWNDFIVGSWADPTVLKVGDEYFMYVSAMHGGISTPEAINIYRFSSPDGYSWIMDPVAPVLEHVAGTYYEGGIETPNVVFFNGTFHMYNTVYLQNIPALFKISHATSPDGITWTMDNSAALIPDPAVDWMSEVIAEPGAVVKDDTLYLFYTAISDIGAVSIGLVRSLDGSSFFDTTQVVTIPNDIYPASDDYLGLSTPDATLVGDTIYLFTDLVRTDTHTYWNQVGLQQFKCYGDINKWYYDTTHIHMASDFNWTDGNYLSQLLGATPLMDGNRLRLWYWGYDLAQVSPIDTTYHIYSNGPDNYPEPGHWGIGTSEYVYPSMANITEKNYIDQNIMIEYNKNLGIINTDNSLPSVVNIYSISGQLLYHNTFTNTHNFNINYSGVILIHVINDGSILTKKFISGH
jgi:hypothetical protein